MRALKSSEVEVRVGTVGAKGVTLLLYKNARVDRKILDEEFGAMNWQCDFKEIKGNMYCGIAVYDTKKAMWVWKWDCGTESNTEKEKGEASDAFKRAGFKWGIGSELYYTPFLFLPIPTEEYAPKKYRLKNPREISGLYVSSMTVKEVDGIKQVTDLDIAQNGVVVWSTRRGKVGLRHE